MSENIPPQRRQVIVSRDENYFYRAVALRKDEISDEKQKQIPWSSEKQDLVKESKILSRKARSQELRQKI